MQKNWLPVVLVIAIGSSVLLGNGTNNDTSKDDSNIKEIITQSPTSCFLYEERVSYEGLNDDNVYDREYIELSITDTGLTSGKHFILPYEKYSNRATLVGVSSDGFINVVATATAEGETWQEQRVYKITDDRLLVGYQEVYVPQYQNKDGIYLYEDIQKLVFETEEFYLPVIDCQSVDNSAFN